jgi:phosphodiesterase/alkaline phosphatase D-like protein
VEIIILDERSCRSASVASSCNLLPLGISDPAPTLPAAQRQQLGLPAAPPAGCLDAIRDPARTMLGGVQKELFKNALVSSQAKFKFVISSVPIQAFYLLPFDRWEGFAAEREEILDFIREHSIENVIFLAADTHANLVNEVFVDAFSDPEPVSREFVTGPIATTTLEDSINLLPIPNALQKVNELFDTIGIDCRHLDAYSYGLVEANPLQNHVTVTLKDDTGAPLFDQSHPQVECRQVIQIPSEQFLPVVQKP